MLKLNLGGGPKRIEGFKNVDALEWDGVTDFVMNLIDFPWKFETNSIDEIIMEECLEHLSFRATDSVLYECHRILKPEGKIKIQVPDCGKAMEYFVNNEICECVLHKAKTWDDYKADPQCFACGGKAKINPMRWLFSFTGAQKHPFDVHKAIFTKEILENKIKVIGFRQIEFQNNLYKLIVNAKK